MLLAMHLLEESQSTSWTFSTKIPVTGITYHVKILRVFIIPTGAFRRFFEKQNYYLEGMTQGIPYQESNKEKTQS